MIITGRIKERVINAVLIMLLFLGIGLYSFFAQRQNPTTFQDKAKVEVPARRF